MNDNTSKTTRISLTVGLDELENWKLANNRESLSAFIREAVNEYIRITDPKKTTTLLDMITENKNEITHNRSRLIRLDKLEADVIDIVAVLAKHNMIDFDKSSEEWKEKQHY